MIFPKNPNLILTQSLHYSCVVDLENAESCIKWCKQNLGDRYIYWTYVGNGKWKFLRENDCIWFKLIWG